jgi:hypothetical protein
MDSNSIDSLDIILTSMASRFTNFKCFLGQSKNAVAFSVLSTFDKKYSRNNFYFTTPFEDLFGPNVPQLSSGQFSTRFV